MDVDFGGVKIALFAEDKLIVILRDDKPGLRWRNLWDLPGGARDGNESPIECVTREVKEELGIDLDPTAIVWQKEYPSMHDASQVAYFMAASVSPDQVQGITFGDEGQTWKLMTTDEFLADQRVIGPLKGRLRDYLASPKSGSNA